MKCIGYSQDSSLSSAQRLPNIPAGANAALLQAEAQNLRVRLDAGTPTSSVGHLLEAGDEMWLEGDLNDVRVIEVTSGGIANVHYFDA